MATNGNIGKWLYSFRRPFNKSAEDGEESEEDGSEDEFQQELGVLIKPRSPRSEPLNDKLPSDILEAIFRFLVLWAAPRSPPHLGPVKLVCRSWSEVAVWLEFVRLEVDSRCKIDDLLAHLEKVRTPGGLKRAGVIRMKIFTENKRDFYRIDELFPLFQSSVVALCMSRSPLPPEEPEDAINLLFEKIPEEVRHLSNIRTLALREFHWYEVTPLLLACNPDTLQSLSLSHGLLELSGLKNLYLPKLENFEIGMRVFGPDTQIERSWQLFLKSAPALKCITIHIRRSDLPWMVDFLTEDVPKNLQVLRIWLKMDIQKPLDENDAPFKRLLDLVRQRRWTKWVCAYVYGKSWLVDDD